MAILRRLLAMGDALLARARPSVEATAAIVRV